MTRHLPMKHVSPTTRGSLDDDLRGLSMVYYVRRRGYVKIGYSASIMARLRSLHVKPTDILAWEYGDRILEAIRHDQFAHARAEGDGLGVEHYHLTPDLAEHIEAVRAAMIGRATRRGGRVLDTMRDGAG